MPGCPCPILEAENNGEESEMNLGETICRLRTQAGLSQSDLADALEVSRQSVSKWETNASVPDLDKLIRMSEFFRVSLDELVKGSGEPETPPAEPCPAAAPESVTAPELAEPAPRRTRARSVGIGLLCAAAVAAVVCVAPVSYTHLGEYKRQEHSPGRFCSLDRKNRCIYNSCICKYLSLIHI